MQHPQDFKGHSLSVGDVVALKEDGKTSYHFEDSFGFKEIPFENVVSNKLTHSEEVDADIHEWVLLIKNCTDIQSINRELMIKLVDKIILGQKAVVDGVQQQDIKLIYNLIGEVNPPS